MKKGIAGKAGTNLRGSEAITETSTEGILHPEMTAREEDPEITETRAAEATSVHPRKG